MANVEINTNTKAKLKSQTNIRKTRGTPNDFGEKTGKFDTYTFGGRGKLRGENCEPRKNNTFGSKHAHKDNSTTTLCAPILTHFGFPLF